MDRSEDVSDTAEWLVLGCLRSDKTAQALKIAEKTPQPFKNSAYSLIFNDLVQRKDLQILESIQKFPEQEAYTLGKIALTLASQGDIQTASKIIIELGKTPANVFEQDICLSSLLTNNLTQARRLATILPKSDMPLFYRLAVAEGADEYFSIAEEISHPQEKLSWSSKTVLEYIDNWNWDDALKIAETIPDHPTRLNLLQKINNRRALHKKWVELEGRG